MRIWFGATLAVLVGLGVGGCGGNDSAGHHTASAATSRPTTEEACTAARSSEPRASTPSSDDAAKSAGEIRKVASKFPKGTMESDALGALADAYKKQSAASGSQESTEAAAAVESAWNTLSTVCGDTPAAEPVTPAPAPNPLAGKFPKGYPKKVRVSDIPFPINSAYEGMKFAVQLAPGVYTALPPGAHVRGAALGVVADGYCASIKAYSRKYRGGQEFGGSCW